MSSRSLYNTSSSRQLPSQKLTTNNHTNNNRYNTSSNFYVPQHSPRQKSFFSFPSSLITTNASGTFNNSNNNYNESSLQPTTSSSGSLFPAKSKSFTANSSNTNNNANSVRNHSSFQSFQNLLRSLQYFPQLATPSQSSQTDINSNTAATNSTNSSNATDSASNRPVSEYFAAQAALKLATEQQQLSQQRQEVFQRVDQMMMDVDDGDNGEEAQTQALLAARKFELSKEQMQQVKSVIFGPMDNTIVIEKYSIDMTRKQIACLRPATWLNDEVINFYMSMLMERDVKRVSDYNTNNKNKQQKLTSHYFNSFFMAKLLEQDTYTYANVRRWTKKFDILEKDKIFIPVNVHNTHWTLLVVFMQRREIHYYDSMSGAGHVYTRAIARWIVDDVRDKKGAKGEAEVGDVSTTWTVKSRMADVPQQQNGYDCGVFTITFADYLSDDLPLQFGQADVAQNRFRIAYQIINQGTMQY